MACRFFISVSSYSFADEKRTAVELHVHTALATSCLGQGKAIGVRHRVFLPEALENS